MPYFPGISQPAYNPDDYKKDPVTYNGKQYSYYEATQEQRKIERAIRSWKRKAAAAEAAGLDSGMERGKVKAWQAKMRRFCEETKLKRQPNRERPIS